MNRSWVLQNLREAHDELGATIADLESDARYDAGEFMVAMLHLYHHLNTAWNSRDKPAARVKQCDERDFFAWRRFPEDLHLGP